MKFRKYPIYLILALSVPALLTFCAGCGSSSSGPNAISVSLSGSTILILNQSTTITATVTGATNTNVTWGGGSQNLPACQFTTTTVNSSGTPTTSTATACPSDNSLGTLSNEQASGTATFTAPNKLPSPTTFPGLQIIINACSVQQTNKCGLLKIVIDSGVSVTLNPPSAAVPTKEQQPFFATVANDIDPSHKGVTWLLTQQIPQSTSTTSTNTNIYASLTTCTVSGNASGCGSIDTNGVYTAPSVVPTVTVPASTTAAPTTTTPADVTIVATSVDDPTRFAIGTIVITQGGPITFNGISPTIAPAGAAFWDIFLNAPNISSASQIILTDTSGGQKTLNSASGQVKILFPPTTSSSSSSTTTTSPASTGARIRLLTNDLVIPRSQTGPLSVTVSVQDSGQPVTTCTGTPLPSGCTSAGTFTYTILPVRPTVTAFSPNDVIQNTVVTPNNSVPLTVDGGYFGLNGQQVQATFQGTPLVGRTDANNNPISTSKQLSLQFQTGPINTGLPGLYPLSVTANNGPFPLPVQNSPTLLDLAVFPGYAKDPPQVTGYASTAAMPSAIDIDPTLGVAVVAETGANAVQFYTIGSGSLTPLGSAVPVGQVPTGLSVNRTNHTVAVVNYMDQSVTVLPIPGAPVAPGTPFTFSIAGVLQGAVANPPLPYSIGVDPDTNMGVVAYSATSTTTLSNLGFLVDLNPNGTSKCVPFSNGPTAPPCAFAQVTLNTGSNPQVAMAPHGHLAFVSPGGAGALHAIDVTRPSNSIGIQSLTLAAGIVTVQTTLCNTSPISTPNEILFPGNSGTVLITGVPLQNAAGNTNFNGLYTANAISDTSFTFIVNPAFATNTGTVTIPNVTLNCPSTPSTTPIPPAPSSANVFFNSPNVTLSGISPTAQGIAINPITSNAALADTNATGTNGSQLNLVNSLDQNVSAISFTSLCTAYTTVCLNSAPELLGTADVAWQPFSNALVSYNPGINVNQVSISDPTTARRFALVCELAGVGGNTKTGTGSACLTDPGTQINGSVCTTPSISDCEQIYNTQVTLLGTGEATLKVNNGTTGTLTLFGGLAVDAATNQAFVVMSGSNQIDIVDLGPCRTGSCVDPPNSLKPVEVSEILVPTPASQAGVLGAIGGIPGAAVPQGTLVSNTDLAGVKIFGAGFDASSIVRLDGNQLPASDVTFVNSRQLTVTIPANPYLSFPHRFALDVVTPDLGSVQSNPTDFFVIQAVDLSQVCPPATAMPSSVAVADQLANGPFAPIAVVTNSGCNNIAVVDVNPTATANGQVVQNPNFGKILGTVAVGSSPQGVAVSQPLGLAVVANNGDGTASVVNLLTNAAAVPAVSTGTNPTGVAIDSETGAALVTNPGSQTVTEINLSPLFASPPATSLTPISAGGVQQPTAVAIDPDRGTNNQGIAVVTELQIANGALPTGALEVLDIGLSTPVPSATLTTGSVIAPATGIVFDPTVVTGTANPGVFYVSSSGGNTISSFNPDSGSQSSANVGINPTALALNPQTGALMTTNVAGNTTSLVDTSASPFRTVQTIGLPGSAQFGIAIDQFTNLAVIVDQANNRLLILPASK